MKYLFVDIKTSGLSPEENSILSIHSVVDISGIIEGSQHLLMAPLPGKVLDDKALVLNNMSTEEVLSFPSSQLQLINWKSFLSDYLVELDEQDKFILVAYNTLFVMGFLQSWFEYYKDESFFDFFKVQPVDILNLAKIYFLNSEREPANFKKESLLDFFKIRSNNETSLRTLYYRIYKAVNIKNAYIDLDDLNESQKEAVKYTDGPLLVLAGAGSGKTRVITYKIGYLISHLMYSADSILAVTFTNKAAKEMRERLNTLLGSKLVRGLTVSTFHSLGLEILKKECSHLGYINEFSIFGDSEKESLLKESLIELKYSEQDYPLAYISKFISQKKNLLQTPEEIAETKTPQQDIYRLYERKLKENNAFDFDDLIFKPLLLFSQKEDVKKYWVYRFRYILVDEYQDINHAQYQLMKVLSGGYSNICAVGDDDQSIYAFRGADIVNILSFGKDFNNAHRIVLNYNYRNSPSILKAAMSLIDYNHGRHKKTVLSSRAEEDSQRIFLYKADDQEDEANWIAQEIFTNRIDRAVPYNHQAILCRTNSQMRIIEKALRQENIRYHIIGGFSFFDRVEVKIVFSYLRLLYNSQDNQAFYRVINFPKRGIGDKSLDVFTQYAQEKGLSLLKACNHASEIPGIGKTAINSLESFANTYWNIYSQLESDMLSQVIENMYIEFGLKDELYRVYKDEAPQRINSLTDIQMDILKKERRFSFKNSEEKYGLALYLQETILSQLKEDDDIKDEDQKVLLITIHSAKGLEFQSVFIPGFQEGIFPHERSLDDEFSVEEERRLAYVALTRAKDYLFLSHSEYRKIQGEDREQKSSRFLLEIPVDLITLSISDNQSTCDEIKYLEEMKKMLRIEEE